MPDADRASLIDRFLRDAGWADAERRPLAGDASFRRYERLVRSGASVVLMDAPPPQEDLRPFLSVRRHLERLGYSAPGLHAADVAAGLALLEDLGDDTYTRRLAAGGDEEALYALAVDLLIDLHARPGAAALAVPAYDDAAMIDKASLLIDWYLPAVRGERAPAALRDSFRDAWRAVLPLARRVPATLILRDYHVDNLMWLPGRSGVAACGLLDFQDAAIGPAPYDLVSLLQDARRDLAPGLEAAMIRRYRQAFPGLDDGRFAAAYAVLGAQRNARIIGIFARLCVRDGKPGYLRHLPRLWRLLEADLRHPALAGLRDWLDRHLPASSRIVPPAKDEAAA